MTATITIAAHMRVYSDSEVAVDAGSLTTYHDGSAIADGDTVYVYYDDAARQGGAVAYAATLTSGNAVLSATFPARHYVGVITVPSSGTSSGTSGAPAGGIAPAERIGAGFR